MVNDSGFDCVGNFLVLNGDVVPLDLLDGIVSSLQDGYNFFLAGEAGVGKTTILLTLTYYLNSLTGADGKTKRFFAVYLPSLTPAVQTLKNICVALGEPPKTVSRMNKREALFHILSRISEISRLGMKTIFVCDEVNHIPGGLRQIFVSLLDMTLSKSNALNIVGAGRKMPKDERMRFYFTKRLRAPKLSKDQAKMIIAENYGLDDPNTVGSIIDHANGSPIALQLGCKIVSGTGRSLDELEGEDSSFGAVIDEASQQYTIEALPYGVLLVVAYVVVGLRFFMYWPAIIAVAFCFFFAIRSAILEAIRYMEWRHAVGGV